jgi:hypothetical protein
VNIATEDGDSDREFCGKRLKPLHKVQTFLLVGASSIMVIKVI